MGIEGLQELAEIFALGRVTSRQAVRDAFAEAELAVPPGSAEADSQSLSESYTMLVYVDDSAGQASFLFYRDSAVPDSLAAALELMNGWAAASPADVASGEQQFALARVVALNNSGLQIHEWVSPEHSGDPNCPDQAELDTLSELAASDYFVVNRDGSVWKNGPQPPKDLLDRTFSRVVSFNLTM